MFRRNQQCKYKKNTFQSNPINVAGNRTFIVLDEAKHLMNVTKGSFTTNKDPAIIRKKIHCICSLPVCKCKTDSPDSWYVKTYIDSSVEMMPARYTVWHQIDPLNESTEISCCPEPLVENKKNLEFKFGKNFVLQKPKKQLTQKRNKWLFGCPPLINLSKKPTVWKTENKVGFRCECMQCRFQSRNDKSGVLMKCYKCGPIYSNKSNVQINFSNLILKKNNKLKLNVSFLQFT